ncbi:McrB family protein [Exiguobacterium artemiae]|uniref:McrB family protein n=1 Tax=Exiguobacterium artemiae TaxID=340145 RepID=UPI0029651FAC|nr:hypothetical protein [Exiguobacterium sibiricum]MDW2886154.1 hypothetical protein [Exiguobacterium sibiricum]
MELDVFLIGSLANEARFKEHNRNFSVIRNVNDFTNLQFFLEILNEDDIPSDYQKIFKNKFVAGYDDILKNEEWETLLKDTPLYDKEIAFREFAADKLFIFKPYIEENKYGDKQIKISKKSDLRIIKRPEGISDNSVGSLVTIPIYSDYNRYSFEKRLLESKSIGNYDYLEKITTSCLVSGDYLYGEFNDFEKLNDGWHVSPNGVIKKVAIDFEFYKDYSIIEDHAIYMDFEFFREIILEEGLLKNGEIVRLNKTIKLKEISEETYEEFEEFEESEFILQLLENLKQKKLVFEEKQVINFHTALKTRRLVILGGASGTGKSQLVLNYAESLGLTNKDNNQFKMVPVKPNWKDDSDLIGYLDTINNIYRPSETGLIDILIEAKDNKDKIFMVCFDEMNLAKVEHYFSQFLSVLELYGNERKLSLYSKKLVGRVINGEQYPHEITIHSNVLFVGTINVDETTQTLSDKVLDRSNFIEFNTPTNHINNWADSIKQNIDTKSIKDNRFEKTVVDLYHFDNWSNNDKEIALNIFEIETLNQINNTLTKTDFSKGIGFRVLDHINSYMLNLPNSSLSREEAFDLQISQKIIPKIRGTAEELEGILLDNKNGLLNVFDENNNFKVTVSNIKNKIREINLYGYTY